MSWPAGPGQPPGQGGLVPAPLRPPEPAPEPRPRQVGRGWLIAAGVAGVLAVGAVVAVVFFRKGDPQKTVSVGAAAGLPAATRSSAHDHVPRGCELVLRVDVAKMLAVPAVKKAFGPVLDEITTGADAAGRKTRDFLHEAGVDPRQDVKELTVCVAGLGGPVAQQRLAIVLTGSFPAGGVASALEAQARSSSEKLEVGTFDGRKLIKTRSKGGQPLMIGQAADGAIVVTNDTPFFETSAVPSQNEPSYGIPPKGEGVLLVDPKFLAGGGFADSPIGRHVKDITRLAGSATFSPARGELTIATTGPTEAGALGATLTALVAAAKKDASGAVPDAGVPPGGAFADAKVRVQGNEVIVELPWSDAIVERAAQKAADWLHDAHQKGNLSL